MPSPTLIGIVGFTPVVEAYPLGPRLMALLEAGVSGREGVAVENMSWGPIHIVQRFQDEDAPRPGRIVLIGAAAVCAHPGQVRAYRWKGGVQPAQALQERVYEAVTGIVDIENTLVIGEHFGIWPQECYSVEAELPAETFGRMVMAEAEGRRGALLAAELGFDPAACIAEIAALTLPLALGDPAAAVGLAAKCADDLVPVQAFLKNAAAGSAGEGEVG